MTECFCTDGRIQSFGYKRNPNGKIYTGQFDLHDRGNKFEIWNLEVGKRFRNKGYGTQMLTEFLSQFKSDKPLFLYVYKTNEIAIKLYEKVGFTIVGDFSTDAYTMKYNRKETAQNGKQN